MGHLQGNKSFPIWKDLSERSRIWPITFIKCNLPEKGIIPLGRYYTEYTGSIPDTVRIVSVNAADSTTEISLTKSPFKSLVKACGGIIVFKRSFRLKKIDMPATIEDGHVQTWEYIAISPDNRHCAVSSFDKNIYVIDIRTGAVSWKYNIHDGELSCIAYSKDGKHILAGEHSTDGFVYCFNSADGHLVWKYRTADDIGSLENTMLAGGRWGGIVKPNAREIIAGPDSLAFFRATRSRYYMSGNVKVKEAINRIYCINIRSGKKIWTYPSDSNLVNVSPSTINTSKDGSYVSWVYFDYDKKINPVVMVFDGRNGSIRWKYQTNTVDKYYSSSTAYSGLCFSDDNTFAALPQNDGRIFIFNNDSSAEASSGIVHSILSVTPPIDAGLTPVMTYMSKAAFTHNGNLVVLTGNTYTTPFASTKTPPLCHPQANSVFCLSVDGDLKWRFTAGGNPSDLSLSYGKKGEYLILPCAHNIRSKDLKEHGFYIFNVSGEDGSFSRLKCFYHTDGICVNASFSPDQENVFAIEAPIDMDESEKISLKGLHRVLFFDSESIDDSLSVRNY